MKIAILSDIHANIFALNAVLKDFEKMNIESVWILGDIVGYHYWPKETLELIDRLPNVELIQGNHERLLQKAASCEDQKNEILKKYGSGINIALEQMSDLDKQRLYDLPLTKTIRVDGVSCLLCHGSSQDPDEYVYPDSDPKKLEACLSTDADYVFQGHTHYPFIFSKNNKVLVNPGSVGQPRERDQLASYVVFNTSAKTVVFRKVAFDCQPLIEGIKATDPNLPFLYKYFSKESNE